jgi:hypothetical protein
MKKLYTTTLAAGLALSLTACAGTGASNVSVASAAKADVENVCSVEKHGIANVIATAKAYNSVAKKEGVEFRRLGINNSSAIAAVEAGIKSGAKEVKPADIKGKTKQKFEINYAAERACKFAIGALSQKAEGKNTWRLAVPGDGYQY